MLSQLPWSIWFLVVGAFGIVVTNAALLIWVCWPELCHLWRRS